MSKIIYHHYCYRIDFSDGFFYIGSRRSTLPPSEDVKYMGSPITHKAKWNDPTLTKTKTILRENYSSFEEMRDHEIELIRQAWDFDLEHCLNERCGGYMTLRLLREHGLKMKELKKGIHAQTKEEKHELGRQTYLSKSGLFAMSPEKRSEVSRKAYANGLGNQSKETLSQNGIRGRRKFVEENSKRVTFISPDGAEYPNQILAYFCKEHNLDYAAMKYIAKKNGKARPHRGWSARYQTPDR